MKPLTLLLAAVFTFLCARDGTSQIKLNGYFQSSGYGWENINQNQQFDYYQAFRLRVSPSNYRNLYLNTYLRAAYRGDPADWEEKFYNLYMNWDITDNYKIRFGRQFIYSGVMNGTIDGALVKAQFARGTGFKVLIGTEAPFRRTFGVLDWDEGNALGGYLSQVFLQNHRLEVSYFQKSRRDAKYWQQMGASVNGYLTSQLNYYARFDYNLLSSVYQLMRYRLTYFAPKWSLSAEYSSQKPRIYEDSFFNIFKIRAYNQVRTAANYQWGQFQLGLQHLFTMYAEDETDHRVIGTVSNRYGTIGLIWQTGFGGQNVGPYGEVRYELLSNLTGRIYVSYYNYERTVTNLNEEALAFAAGLRYRLQNMIHLMGEIQQTSNNLYDNDVRGLLRVTYLFDI